jgi:hypothetical protein
MLRTLQNESNPTEDMGEKFLTGRELHAGEFEKPL